MTLIILEKILFVKKIALSDKKIPELLNSGIFKFTKSNKLLTKELLL